MQLFLTGEYWLKCLQRLSIWKIHLKISIQEFFYI
jgi:hypothetical protein